MTDKQKGHDEEDLKSEVLTSGGEDVFDNWKRVELEDEHMTSEGVYLGDGVYSGG